MGHSSALVVANWKNNTRLAEASVLSIGVRNHLEDLEGLRVVLCPPLPWLTAVHELVISVPHLSVGVQDLSGEPEGPSTGEVAASLLKGIATHAIIGHSERQFLYRETVERLHDKIRAALTAGITPVICVGEERRSSGSVGLLSRRLGHLLKPFTHTERHKMVVAYEPIWAISKGKTPKHAATPEYANDVATAWRGIVPQTTRILYGGSVTAANVGEFIAQPELDGVLVGGASLKLREFSTLLKNAARAAQA